MPETEFNAPLIIEDAGIDDVLDAKLRTLLSTCFTKPSDESFKNQRYWREAPRWHGLIRHSGGRLAAHTAVHDKVVWCENRRFRIGGVGDVCVHPDFRGQKLVRTLLKTIHTFLEREAVDFGMLFGDPGIYGSSGYRAVPNVVYDALQPDGSSQRKPASPLIRPIVTPWPEAEVYLPGRIF